MGITALPYDSLFSTGDAEHDIGSPTNRLNRVYAVTYYGDGSNLTGISGGGSVDLGADYSWTGIHTWNDVSRFNDTVDVGDSITLEPSNGLFSASSVAIGDAVTLSESFDNLAVSGRVNSAGVTVGFNDALAINDVELRRDASGILAQRNGTTAQLLRVYNTYTNASNNEALEAGFVSNNAYVRTIANGTGVGRNLWLLAGGTAIVMGVSGVAGFLMDSIQFEPFADAGRSLGRSARRFNEVHAVTFHGDGSNLTGLGGVDLAADYDWTGQHTWSSELRLRGVYTDASNYERFVHRYESNEWHFGPESAGTGADRNVCFLLGASRTFTFDGTGFTVLNVGRTGTGSPEIKLRNISAMKYYAGQIQLSNTRYLFGATQNFTEANAVIQTNLAADVDFLAARGPSSGTASVLKINAHPSNGSGSPVEVNSDGSMIMAGDITFTGLPTSDPANAGQLWNDAGTVKVSSG